MQLKPMRVGSVQLYTTGLSQADKQLTGVGIIEDSINDAVRRCVEASGEQSVAVIPEGPYVVPAFRPEA